MKEKKEFMGIILKAIPVVAIAVLLSMTGIGGLIVGVQPSNLAPVADADGPYSGWVGETIIFDGSGSTGDIINWTWDFGDGHKGYGEITTHVYTTAGTYVVTLAVLSSAYEMDTDSTYAYIYEHNYAPVADADGPYYGDVGIPISFDGCNSYDIDGTIVSYSWNFGDGHYGSGPTPSHAYLAAGTYVVTLTVTDDDGATDSDTTYAYIGANQCPIADAGGPYTANVGDAITFDASASYDPDGYIIGYRWDWTNDGTWDTAWMSTPYATHSYSSTGTFTVKLEVKDNDGATDTDLTTVTIPGGNQAPAVPQRPSGPTVGYVWYSYTYTTYTTDPEGDQIRYCFDWGDGTTSWTIFYNSGEVASAFHTWSYQGSYSVRVKAEDEHGAQSDWSEPLPITMPLRFSVTDDSGMPIENGGLYVFGRKIIPTPNTIIIGGIAVEPKIENENPETPLDAVVEFYLFQGSSGILKHVAYSPPYRWVINEPLVGRYTLMVVVHDNEKRYVVSDSVDIIFFILGTRLTESQV